MILHEHFVDYEDYTDDPRNMNYAWMEAEAIKKAKQWTTFPSSRHAIHFQPPQLVMTGGAFWSGDLCPDCHG